MIYTIPIILSFALFGYYLTVAFPGKVSPTGETPESIETRVLVPAWNRIRAFIHAITPKGKLERIVAKAASLNIRLDPVVVTVGQLMSGIAAFVFLNMTIHLKLPIPHWTIPLMGALICYWIPEWIIDSLIKERQTKIRLALPGLLDSIIMHLNAGHSIDQAVKNIILARRDKIRREADPTVEEDYLTNYKGRPLYEEFAKAWVSMLKGGSRERAYGGIIKRAGVLELTEVLQAILLALRLGADLTITLKAQAANLLIKRRQQAEEAGEKAPLKIAMVAFCFFFAFLMVMGAIMWPGMQEVVINLRGGV